MPHPLDPSTAKAKCEKACRPEEECRFLNGTWDCLCRQDLNSSGKWLGGAGMWEQCHRWRLSEAAGREPQRVRTRYRPESVGMELRSGNESSQSHLQGWESRDATNCQVSLRTMVSESSSGMGQLDPQGERYYGQAPC